jgi:hypothetical protein
VLKQSSLAGAAEFRTQTQLLADHPNAVDIMIDVLSDRGFRWAAGGGPCLCLQSVCPQRDLRYRPQAACVVPHACNLLYTPADSSSGQYQRGEQREALSGLQPGSRSRPVPFPGPSLGREACAVPAAVSPYSLPLPSCLCLPARLQCRTHPGGAAGAPARGPCHWGHQAAHRPRARVQVCSVCGVCDDCREGMLQAELRSHAPCARTRPVPSPTAAGPRGTACVVGESLTHLLNSIMCLAAGAYFVCRLF